MSYYLPKLVSTKFNFHDVFIEFKDVKLNADLKTFIINQALCFFQSLCMIDNELH